MKLLNLILFSVILTLFSCQEKVKNETAKTSEERAIASANKEDKIEVIDFYGTHRCVTCKAIEANAKYTVETYFADNPKVVFKTVNVDEEANYDMAEKYEATGTALFLNIVKDGKETHIDLTDFAFSKGKDKESFSQELKAKIDNKLKKI